MVKKTILISLLFLSRGMLTNAQQQKIIAKFIVTDATINNQDVTEQYVNLGGYLVLYAIGKEIYMGNVMSEKNTQSYGRIYSLERRKSKDVPESDILFYRWNYKNNYDNKTGTATVKIIATHKPQGIAYSCTIVPEDLDVLVYKGYVDGTVNFSTFLR